MKEKTLRLIAAASVAGWIGGYASLINALQPKDPFGEIQWCETEYKNSRNFVDIHQDFTDKDFDDFYKHHFQATNRSEGALQLSDLLTYDMRFYSEVSSRNKNGFQDGSLRPKIVLPCKFSEQN